MKRLEVQLLRKAGHAQKEIGEITGVSERSVRRIEREPGVCEFDDGQARQRRRVGRPSKVAAFIAQIAAWIEAEPDLQSGELLRRAREKGYDGGKSQFFEAVRKQRPKKVRPVVRFEGLPGEFTQHDFGQVDVRFLDDSLKRIHFFASRLKWSRWVQVTIVPDERVETVVRTLVDHFVAIGGVPLVAVFDRPKTIALKWQKDGTVTEWNSTFIQVLAELGVGVELCWPYRGQEKGAVENLVGWVKGSFFKQRRFADVADLEQQLGEWLTEANEKRPSRATGVPPRARMSEELARLRSVKIKPDELFLRYPVQVGPTGMVVHEGRSYSMWPDAMGLSGTLFLGRLRVRIAAGRWKTEHDRIFEPGGRSVLPEHRTAMVAAVSGRRGRLYLKREQLLELGPAVLEYFTEIVHRRPRIWFHDIEEMHETLIAFGDRVTLLAIERALEAGNFGGEYVTHYVGQIVHELSAVGQEVH